MGKDSLWAFYGSCHDRNMAERDLHTTDSELLKLCKGHVEQLGEGIVILYFC